MMNMRQEREAFEAWAGKRRFALRQTLSGVYDNDMTHQLWGAWLGRADAALPQQEAWIDADERLPDEFVAVLVFDGECITMAHCDDKGGWMLLDERYRRAERVERWMPLPPLPKSFAGMSR